MGIINILDDKLINKIAAGEMIERPAAVVKELMENSIDAEADQITITIGEGGKSFIKVHDNGNGMTKEDAVLSVQRHATSKISSSDDLFNIISLGFRGEALASIAAVSRIKIITKTKKDEIGTQVDAEGSRIIVVKEIGCNRGTIIEVSSLFYNTPARKKYMKSSRHEHNVIVDIITRYALCYKNISFRLYHGDRLILNSPKTKKMIDNIVSIYGHETGKNLIRIEHKGEVAGIKGYISKPGLTRGDRSQQSVFINGRYVRNKTINDGIYEGYHSMLFTRRHPIAVLFIEINPKKIDVNVHPTKDVIKLQQEKQVFNDTMNAVKNALESSNLAPSIKIDAYENIKSTKRYPMHKDRQSLLMKEPSRMKESSKSMESQIIKEETNLKPEAVRQRVPEAPASRDTIGAYRILGQINRTYIIAETPEGIMIIDQHAAEERVNYEILMDEYKNKGISIQKLLRPTIIELSPAEKNIIMDNSEILKKTGFEIEQYGKNSFLVRTIPSIFGRYYNNLIFDLIKELKADTRKVDEIKEERIIRFSCRKSIKAGKEMNINEMEALMNKVEDAKQPFTCPHGRPTMIRITIGELEKKFKRTG